MLTMLMRLSLIRRLYLWIKTVYTNACRIVPDDVYIKFIYRIKMGKKLNLDKPVSFNEKLQWLKLHDRNEKYSVMVDKYLVRKYVAEKIGEGYLIPVLGVYDKVEDIDVNKLPGKFVIKCTHDSGSVVLCKEKQDFTQAVRKELNIALKRKYYYAYREFPYKNIKPRIIIEEMMYDKDSVGGGLIDYKFYCFHGEPKFLYISSGLDNHRTAHISFYNLDLSEAPFQRKDYMQFDVIPKIPVNYQEMIEVAKVLSKEIPFVRIDLYEIDKKVYFSEITFSPTAGMMPFAPEEYDEILGSYIDLDNLNK